MKYSSYLAVLILTCHPEVHHADHFLLHDHQIYDADDAFPFFHEHSCEDDEYYFYDADCVKQVCHVYPYEKDEHHSYDVDCDVIAYDV